MQKSLTVTGAEDSEFLVMTCLGIALMLWDEVFVVLA